MVRGWDFTRSSRWTFGYFLAFRIICLPFHLARRLYYSFTELRHCAFLLVCTTQPASGPGRILLPSRGVAVQSSSACTEIRPFVSTIDDMETHLPRRMRAEIIAVSLLSKYRCLLWLAASEAWKVCMYFFRHNEMGLLLET